MMTRQTQTEYVTMAGAARDLGICGATFRRKMALAGIEPHARLISGSCKGDTLLFEKDSLEDLRVALLATAPESQ